MHKKILVALDLSDANASLTFNNAKSLASISDAELHVLSVIPSYGMPMVGSFFPENYVSDLIESGKTALKDFLNAENAGDGIKGHVTNGTIYDEILHAADQLQCDLIVLAANRPELKDYLLGPNAARVVRHAKQSVFVVRGT